MDDRTQKAAAKTETASPSFMFAIVLAFAAMAQPILGLSAYPLLVVFAFLISVSILAVPGGMLILPVISLASWSASFGVSHPFICCALALPSIMVRIGEMREADLSTDQNRKRASNRLPLLWLAHLMLCWSNFAFSPRVQFDIRAFGG